MYRYGRLSPGLIPESLADTFTTSSSMGPQLGLIRVTKWSAGSGQGVLHRNFVALPTAELPRYGRMAPRAVNREE